MKERIILVLASALNISKGSINDDLHYGSIPEWDSISHMLLMNEIETEFKISLSQSDIFKMTSFLGIENVVKELI